MTEATANEDVGRSKAGAASDLAVIRAQTTESLELLRSLVALMLPKRAESDKPKLEDLIATLVAQQREIVFGVRHIQADLTALFVRLDDGSPARPNGLGRPNGAGRA